MSDLKPLIAKLAAGQNLTQAEAQEAFDVMMSGEATPTQIGAILMGLRVRGETIEEIAGAVTSMRSRMLPVDAPEGAIDIVGTGGDASGTYNISTGAAFVVAGAGVPVAKHGNRALSSRSGAADCLTALGVNLDLPPEGIARCIREAGIGFMFAPNHHAAMRHVGPSRVEIGTRTIFNLLGPLSNPARVKRYMLGVFAKEWVAPIANALKNLDAEVAWVVHGTFGENAGIDEISTTGRTYVAELKDGHVRSFEIHPSEFEVEECQPEDLKGGTGEENAAKLKAMLEGELGPYRDVVVANAAAALIVAGKTDLVQEAADMAKHAIDSGQAKEALDALIRVSGEAAGAA
ncbi:anthranilate phosphoribosyltransferase [Afifella sp. IM 167]|uniref:anthranilate phosphoribosyltransferase n=1 Tax=Afifella sp. IM 167 TaxID=2033586 RepID=UPI001CCED9DF|nr:anthranilate phosphoribosyltransferase [Afifella sp. IM 167]MBZ8132332.1 anthranilate phosphoribosyltransferase [Afifella sp. IM 167]